MNLQPQRDGTRTLCRDLEEAFCSCTRYPALLPVRWTHAPRAKWTRQSLEPPPRSNVEDGQTLASQVAEGHVASCHRHDQRDERSGDLGTITVRSVTIGRSKAETGDPPFGADQDVRLLVTVRDCDKGCFEVLMLEF